MNVWETLRGHWFVACTTRSLGRRPRTATVLGTPLVLYRSAGAVVVAEDRCPHRNAPLSDGSLRDGRLRCPYHGWTFDGAGRCVEAPGMAPACVPRVTLRRWRACEVDGLVWVAAAETVEASEAASTAGASGAIDALGGRPASRSTSGVESDARPDLCGFTMCDELEADLADALENLLDGTHTPFVHAGLVRGVASRQTFTATVRRRDDLVEAEYRGETGQNGLISRWFEPPREASFGRFVPPATAELEYRSRRRLELRVAAHFTPTTAGRLRVFVTCQLPRGRIPAALRFAVIRPFFRRVLRQDREILRRQQQNIARFSERAYVHWPADLLRPWIDAWLRDGRFPEQPDGPQVVEFVL